MSTLAQSLRRLYKSGQVTLEKIESMLVEGKITQDEFDYIVAD